MNDFIKYYTTLKLKKLRCIAQDFNINTHKKTKKQLVHEIYDFIKQKEENDFKIIINHSTF